MRYRKKPVVIDAIQWDGTNKEQVDEFCNAPVNYHGSSGFENGWLLIHTLEGALRAEKGDWIIRGVKGEFYPCKPDIFKQTYEPVLESSK